MEYQRDFFKAGANAYTRLTRWKDSPDFVNYEERPANGWDVRTEGYLPAFPGIGGRLVYEQYYGERVGLSGKDNQQKNPMAVTAGLNYSPFPLAKLSADHRMGKGNQNDTRFGIDISYVFGVPLAQQLDPAALAASRSLAANRYDFVERNNNIVLEYRKKSTISLKLAQQVSGYAGQEKSLGVTVSSTNGFARIDWSAPELFSRGGQIVQVAPLQYNVIIPQYQYGAQAGNSFVISGVAYDQSGNASRQAQSLVVVTAAAVSTVNSTLTPAEINLPADGSATEVLTLTLRDADGNPVTGMAGEISVAINQQARAGGGPEVTDFAEDSSQPGAYNATVKAGANAGTYQITPVVQNVKIAPATLNVGGSPVISNLNLKGTLAVGEALSASYQFDASRGNATDASQYLWGEQGATAAAVAGSGKTVSQSGTVPGYTILATNAGKVLEVSVQAKNGVNITGNTETVNTVPGSTGNDTSGGGNGGTIVNPVAAPAISNLSIEGTLAVGETLSGSYSFDAQTGDPIDASRYLWGAESSTQATVGSNGSIISQSGTVPGYTLSSSDAGNVLEISVQARNSTGVEGNVQTVTTAQNGGGNNTQGGEGNGVVKGVYTFAITPQDRSIGQTLDFQYTVIATADGQSITVPQSAVHWSSGNPAVATIDGSGIATANASGSAVITATGEYQSERFTVTTTMTVVPLVESTLYGTSDGNSDTIVVRPPDYAISMRCGDIVDGMGSVGGIGGAPQTFTDTDNVVSIETTIANWSQMDIISKITFTYKDGSSLSCGSGAGQRPVIQTYTIPADSRLQGYVAYGSDYVNGVRYIVAKK